MDATLMMDFFTSIDVESAALIIRLQIEDSSKLLEEAEGKGKGREGVLSDSQVAAEIYREDLKQSASIIADRQMSTSISRACQTDGNLLFSASSQEQTAAEDREAALKLAGQNSGNETPQWKAFTEFMDPAVLTKLEALNVSKPKADNSRAKKSTSLYVYTKPGAESSTQASFRTPNLARRPCTACQEAFPSHDLARAPCNHEYCRQCLQDLFQASITDDSLFPPRCCRQPIAVNGGSVRQFLTSELVKLYEQKKVEFNTPNRTYCSNQLCSKFIRTENIAKEKAACPDCGTVTCTVCKAGAHIGDCPADTALQQVLEVAREQGWQRCFNCRRLVDLETGCNHMTFVPRTCFE